MNQYVAFALLACIATVAGGRKVKRAAACADQPGFPCAQYKEYFCTHDQLKEACCQTCGSGGGGGGGSGGSQEICVSAHNKLRSLHVGIQPVQWDNNLAMHAQKYAEELLRLNKGSTKEARLVHESPAGGMGENLYWSDRSVETTCADASLSWYKEIKDYDYKTARSRNGNAVGHFTQVVWKNTKRVGVGIATGKSRRYQENVETFIVAKYSPRGNFYYTGQMLRDYTTNVTTRKPGSITPGINQLRV